MLPVNLSRCHEDATSGLTRALRTYGRATSGRKAAKTAAGKPSYQRQASRVDCGRPDKERGSEPRRRVRQGTCSLLLSPADRLTMYREVQVRRRTGCPRVALPTALGSRARPGFLAVGSSACRASSCTQTARRRPCCPCLNTPLAGDTGTTDASASPFRPRACSRSRDPAPCRSRPTR